MLLETALLLGLAHLSGCPNSFSQTNTSVGAISDSKELTLCVSNSYLVRGTNGSLTLVLNSGQTAPKCLIYPNGLSSDMAFDLLSSGHTGCWSLYPPTEPISIVNVGKPSQAKIQSALKSFRPLQPRILVAPAKTVTLGVAFQFSNSAKVEIQKGSLLNLPLEVRFRPVGFRWGFAGKTYSTSSFVSSPTEAGSYLATLSVTFSIEYRFPNLVSWRLVKPNLISMATPISVLVAKPDSLSKQKPKLVDKPCFNPQRWGC